MNSLGVYLLVLGIVGVNSHGWGVQLQYPTIYPRSQPRYPNTGNGKVELVEGTIDQLNNIDAKWICTNQKTGDMMVIGTENGPGNTNNGYPQQHNPWQRPPQRPQQPNFNPQQPQQPNFNPQRPQQPNFNPQQPQQPNFNPQQPQQPNFNPQQPQQPNFNPQQPQQPPQGQNPGFVEVPWTAFPEATQSPSSPLVSTTSDPLKDFDWASYITSTKSSNPTSKLEFDGTGVIESRTGQ